MESILNQLSLSFTENPLLAYVGVFLGGILSSSSPCVLATIPLVIGYVGGYSEGNRRKALLYSLVFILGLSLTFTVLGAIASLIGGLFGMISRTWYFIIGGVAIAIGLHLIGIYQSEYSYSSQSSAKTEGDYRGIFTWRTLWDRLLSLCDTCPCPDSDLCCNKRRGCLWDFPVVHLRPWTLCPDLFSRNSNRLCGKFC